MSAIRFLTGGESHGPALTVVLDGIPAGLRIEPEDIDRDLARRQAGYGRGRRMDVEKDRARVTAGIRCGLTIGSPVVMEIPNLDYSNWVDVMNPWGEAHTDPITMPRPGHADLAGALKYRHGDIRNVLERASARETAARVAAGAVARRLLEGFGIAIASHVLSIGGEHAPIQQSLLMDRPNAGVLRAVESSPVRCADSEAAERMIERIDQARSAGESLGGTFQVIAWGVPPGLGTYAQWDSRLDGRLAQAVMSIPGVKGVSIGDGFRLAALRGGDAADEMTASEHGIRRLTNHGGGLEGGMTNGMPLWLDAAMKPISTMRRPLRSVELGTGREGTAHFERADTCAVPACAVVAEAMVALVLADAFLAKFGGDSVREISSRFRAYLAYLEETGGRCKCT